MTSLYASIGSFIHTMETLQSLTIQQSLLWAEFQVWWCSVVWGCAERKVHMRVQTWGCTCMFKPQAALIPHDAMWAVTTKDTSPYCVYFELIWGFCAFRNLWHLQNFYSSYTQLYNPSQGHDPQLKELWVQQDTQFNSFLKHRQPILYGLQGQWH